MTPILRALFFAVTVSTFVACEKKPETTGEKIENKVGDALDNRPGEKVRDAAEDTKEAVKDATN